MEIDSLRHIKHNEDVQSQLAGTTVEEESIGDDIG